MPDADNIDLTLSLAIPRAFIFPRGIDINVYFLPSSTTSHSSDTPSIFLSSHSALFVRWCQHLGKAWMRVDKKECYLDKPTFSGKVFQLGWQGTSVTEVFFVASHGRAGTWDSPVPPAGGFWHKTFSKSSTTQKNVHNLSPQACWPHTFVFKKDYKVVQARACVILLCMLTVGISEDDFSKDITTHILLKDIQHFFWT